MKVSVDPDKCQGHARCEALCPQVFELDDLGYAVAVNLRVPKGFEAGAERAAANCPESAIEIES